MEPKHGIDSPLPVPVRAAYDADKRAQDESSVFMSISDMQNVPPSVFCRFCSAPVVDQFRPRTLLQVLDAVSKPFAPGTDEDEDEDDAMECSDAGHKFVGLDDMFTPIQCCSAPCWMAATLLRYGESDIIGLMLKNSFPSITPARIGGAHYELFLSRQSRVPCSWL